jgi:peptidoglycan/xylan/chitin deacetylase (PgdA/CDA1 family)
MENPPARFPAWPGDAEVAVSLTFDVDGEAPWLSEGAGYARRLTMLSQGRFGPARGLDRILRLLAEVDVTATFYVPGHTADQHPDAVEAILAGGHEVGLMADDRPYWVTSGTGPLLELPGHWSLCDWPYFGWTSYHGGLLADPAAVERIWLAEFESARQDRRAVTYTMHPEAIGRGYLTRMLDSVIIGMTEHGRPWFATHAQIAGLAGASPVDSVSLH